MRKVLGPYSLFASAMEEVARIYSFSPENPFTFVRSIDYYPVTAGRYSSSIFGTYCGNNVRKMRRKQLYTSARQFLTIRRNLMDTICNVVARSIADPGLKDDIHKMHLTRVRDKCVEYSKILDVADKAEIMVNVEDDMRRMLGYHRDERKRMKRISAFVSQALPIQDHKDTGYKKVDCHEVGGGDNAGRGNETENNTALKGDTSVTTGKSSVAAVQNDDDDDDEVIVLYGMICL